MRSQESIDREAYYDKEIAPLLAELRDKATANNINFLAVCEWDTTGSDEWPTYGRTWGKRDSEAAKPDELQASDLLVGLNTLAERGFLCQNITTLRIVRENPST